MEPNEEMDCVGSQHDRLVSAISKLDKTQHIKYPTRQETANLSEFNLVEKRSKLDLSNVAKVLGSTAHHVQIGKRLASVRAKMPLARPVERPQRERARRAAGYEAAKRTVGRWDAAVARARSVDCVSFPLKTAFTKLESSGEFISKFELKSNLEKELEAVEPPIPTAALESPTTRFPVSYEEALEQRHERARLRAQQSYREAKAKRQNKIKSKKYHRILKKEKLKQQLKEFEELQTKDPEEALKKLEQLEKARAVERHTLRHKNTGKWAKSKLVRAKYDKEVRQQLAEQLAVSRGLTRRPRHDSSSSSSGSDAPAASDLAASNPTNPWLLPIDPAFSVGYSSYLKHTLKTTPPDSSDSDEPTPSADELHTGVKDNVSPAPRRTSETKSNAIATTEWRVEKINCPIAAKSAFATAEMLHEAFESYENTVTTKLNEKLKKLRSNILKSDSTGEGPKIRISPSSKKDNVEYLQFKNSKIVPSLDEELMETIASGGHEHERPEPSEPSEAAQPQPEASATDNIDPTKFIEVKPKHLNSLVPSEQRPAAMDDEEQVVPRVALEDVFEEDDVVASFRQEKAEQAEGGEGAWAGGALPGWGAWGGRGARGRAPRRGRSRFIPAPVPELRRDQNKGDIIIKEFKNPKLSAHKVSDVPFPFVSVKEYEASIRTPLGNTFVPEKAHKRLIQPSMVTKAGAIIEAMDEEQLLTKKKNKLRKFQ